MSTTFHSYTVPLSFAGQGNGLRQLRGIADRRVRIIHTADLLPVGKVPRTDYNSKALRRHLESLSCPWSWPSVTTHAAR
ncbi:hypothetical protein [Actinacidiphila glaucinigra]|uniref:hypothetical protein n=1 Tax=Actinacidiphila glaucinigra TaxID=235986 RepID=UPI003D8ED214